MAMPCDFHSSNRRPSGLAVIALHETETLLGFLGFGVVAFNPNISSKPLAGRVQWRQMTEKMLERRVDTVAGRATVCLGEVDPF